MTAVTFLARRTQSVTRSTSRGPGDHCVLVLAVGVSHPVIGPCHHPHRPAVYVTDIATWLHNFDTGERLVRDSTLEETTGEVLTRLAWKNGEKPRTTTMVEFVLQRRRDSPLGFVVLTAYPTLSEPPSK